MGSLALLGAGPTGPDAPTNWILAGGSWHDTGVWDDTAVWED